MQSFRGGGNGHLIGDDSDLQGDIQAAWLFGFDDDALRNSLLEAGRFHGHSVLAGG